MIAPKKTRNRSPRPAWSFDGMTLESWKASSVHVGWAQTSAEFRDLLTVLVNARALLTIAPPNSTENMQLGIHLGIDRAIACVRSLASGAEAVPAPVPEPTYTSTENIDQIND